MRTVILALTFPLLASACAFIPATPETVAVTAAPTCTGAADCDLKWSAARSFVLSHAGYKFQTYTADFMETYSPVDGARELGARVNREPGANGSTTITAKFWCDSVHDCTPAAGETLNAFNTAVAAASGPR